MGWIQIVATGLMVIGVGSAIAVLVGFRDRPWKPLDKEGSLQDRIIILTASLSEATKIIGNIELEIKARSTLAEQLESDAARYEELIKLKKPEVEAVAQLLRGELQKEGKATFWKGFVVNLLLFVLGAIVSWLVTR
jgi:hypothetical protein